CQVLAPLLLQKEKRGVCSVGFTINEKILTIFQLVPDGRATQARYALRPHPRSYITFQRKIYLTQKLADVLNFIEDLLALTSQIAEQHTPLPVPELPEDTATPSDTEDAGTEEPRRDFERRLSDLEELLRRLAPFKPVH
ncbi:hypothetical protein GBAR_LOCUS31239, partial [Geodia barretti]